MNYRYILQVLKHINNKKNSVYQIYFYQKPKPTMKTEAAYTRIPTGPFENKIINVAPFVSIVN